MPLALYIHWPFCESKCPYCDFNSHVREGVDESAWKAALLSELRTMAAWMPHATLGSIFFGGGTPSLMPPSMTAALIDEAAKLFDLADDIEITLEANPGSSEAKRFADFKNAGVNRLSLGVQSLRQESLSFLKRKHSLSEAIKAIDLSNKLFDRRSFDLIYALPEQSAINWETELLEAVDLAGEHLSLYQLTIEPNTAFHHDYHIKRSFKLPKDCLSEELFLLTQQIMEAAGMPAYEVSNHARTGCESRHNMAYWTGNPYLGVGAGAHGRIFSDNLSPAVASEQMGRPLSRAHGCLTNQATWFASSTYKSPERWLERVECDGHAIEHCEQIDETDRMEEQILTGLRLREGLRLSEGHRACLNAQKIALYQQQGLLIKDGGVLRATHRGWLVLNQLLSEIIT